MSLKEEQSQEHNLRAGLAVFNSYMVPGKSLNGKEKVGDETLIRKESTFSNNASSIMNFDQTSTSPTPSNVKPVGSNKFFMPIKK
ncbi:unnamed protein product [Rotaria sp. Silwood2]|nr:unnamed protein product [Rotaria sp. Silwood2]